MNERNLTMIPGPTNVDPMVLRSMAKPTVSHVSGAFVDVFKETIVDLKRIFKTTGLLLPLAGSGTLGAEVGLANIIEANDKVLAISGGHFGDRLAEVAATLGAKVDKLGVPWGSPVDVGQVELKLEASDYKAMLVVHVDTSTGVANDAKDLAALAKKKNVLFVLDTVCSMGGMNVETDNWGIDVCFTGSQKALAIPPGMTIVSFSPRALRVREKRRSPIGTYYGDIKRWSPILEDPARYFATPPVNMIYALHEACKMVLAEGLDARFARHAKLASAFRSGLRAVGLRLLCDEKAASSTLTVAYYPTDIDDAEFRKAMEEEYGITIAGGLGPLRGKAFRVGHMGNVNANDITATISAIEGSLTKLGYRFEEGAGIAAANRMLRTA